MNKNTTYKQLEDKLVKYKNLKDMPVRENGETFVCLSPVLSEAFGVIGSYGTLTDMQAKFPLVPIRKEVRERLNLADKALKEIDNNLQLVVAYGFRSLEIQESYFEIQKKKYLESGNLEDESIDEVIHRLIAVPTVAGHPTGGAVDVYIENKQSGNSLDFGVPIFTFDSKDVYTFSPFVSEEAKENRNILRKVLMAQNFAPYDGEWWHFSFGDKEWAFYYQQPFALYEQKSEKIVYTDTEKH